MHAVSCGHRLHECASKGYQTSALYLPIWSLLPPPERVTVKLPTCDVFILNESYCQRSFEHFVLSTPRG